MNASALFPVAPFFGYRALPHAGGRHWVSMSVQNVVSQPLVKAVVIINTKGGRVCSRFCDKAMWPDLEAERGFEGTLLKKVQALGEISHGVDIMEFGGHIVAYTQCDDLLMFVTGLASENELILAEVLGSLDESLNILLRGLVYEENVLLHLQGVLLVIDELVDQEGVVMESDPAELVSRAGVQSNSYIDNVPMGEQTLSQALQIAKDQIARSILQG